ncbi:MAG: GGDEF domain-containing protein, partial [Planctomycetota bacterium]
FAKLLKSMCRSGDLVARYGGEEFAVLCADCNNASAAARAEEIRRKLAETPHSELGNKNITASFGVTELQAGDTPETMLRRSDRALLQAKDQGRNQVVQLGDGMTEPVEKKSWWPFAKWGGAKLLEAKLVTEVPIDITVQKLRGFIADHNAKVLKITEQDIRLEASDDGAGMTRRAGDRPVSFLIDIQLTEERVERANAQGFAAGEYAQTTAMVSLRPRRDRDRRRGYAVGRARMLLGSLKSYLMAKEQGVEANAT